MIGYQWFRPFMTREPTVLAILYLLFLEAGCGTGSIRPSQARSSPDAGLDALAHFARECPYKKNAWQPEPPPEKIDQILRQFQNEGRRDHFPFLLEYGLRVYWKNLQNTRLARELPVEKNLMLSELVRLAEIPKYTTAHEAGWLNRQFQSKFDRSGYSSYQIYIWIKEQHYFKRQDYPNIDRLSQLEQVIDSSDLNAVGGSEVCHYFCR